MRTIIRKITLFMVLSGLGCFYAEGQIMYRTRYKSAFQAEVFGISPVMSVNYEIAPLRYKRNFFTGRIGAGYVPGTQNPPKGTPSDFGVSLPVGVSYNYLLNNLKKGITKRVMNKCKTKPPKIDFEWFLETGVGYSLVFYQTSPFRQYAYGVIGLRQQLVIDIPPKPKVIYLRATLNPQYFDNKIRIITPLTNGGYAFSGGVSLGFSLE